MESGLVFSVFTIKSSNQMCGISRNVWSNLLKMLEGWAAPRPGCEEWGIEDQLSRVSMGRTPPEGQQVSPQQPGVTSAGLIRGVMNHTECWAFSSET